MSHPKLWPVYRNLCHLLKTDWFCQDHKWRSLPDTEKHSIARYRYSFNGEQEHAALHECEKEWRVEVHLCLEIGYLVLGGSVCTLKDLSLYASNLYPKRSILVGVPSIHLICTIEGPQLCPNPIRTPWNVLTSVITGNGLETGGLGFYPFKSSGCNRLKLSLQHISLDTAPICYQVYNLGQRNLNKTTTDGGSTASQNCCYHS